MSASAANPTLRAGAIGAAVAWLSGIAMALLTRGVDLQVTQTVEPASRLAAVVADEPRLLLQVIGFDTLFVAGYIAVFCALYACVPQGGRLVGALGLAFGLLAASCDVVENVLYVVYGLGALNGATVTPSLPFHYVVSSLKWNAAFTSVGLTILVFPFGTPIERAAVVVMASLPLGGALSIAFPAFLPLRAVFFLVGMPLFAIMFVARARLPVDAKASS